MRASRNLKFLAAALAFVVGLGTVGFHYIEGWPWFDGFLHGHHYPDHDWI